MDRDGVCDKKRETGILRIMKVSWECVKAGLDWNVVGDREKEKKERDVGNEEEEMDGWNS